MTDAAPRVDLTVSALLARNSAVNTGRDAVVTSDSSITHDGLDRSSRAVALRLIDAGMEAGTRVGLLAQNGIEWAVVACAVMRTGAVLVPLSTLLKVPELAAQLEVAEVEILVCTEEFRGRRIHSEATEAAELQDVPPSVLRLEELVAETFPGVMDDPPEGEALVVMEDVVQPGDDLVVLFTSGSRGVPKGVIHTHGSAVRAVTAGVKARCVGPDDRMYLPMPMFWTGGFSVGLFTTLVVGNALLTEAVAEPTETLALLEGERATLFRGWPDQAARLAAHPDRDRFDLSSLRDASLPALLPPGRRPPPGARPNLLGMTESFGPYCGERLDVDLPRGLWGCCGRPFPGVEVRVVDPDSLADCGVADTGELWLRGPSVLRGICGRSDAEVFAAGRWFRTGDLGYLDSGGHIWFTGRHDDMFKVSGASVYPSEVEAALRAIPGVKEAHVTDVAGEQGPRVAALVVGHNADGTFTEAALTEQARERLSAFKVPTLWHLTIDPAEVPRSATAKVDVERLRTLLAGVEQADLQ